ncbi:MAG: creatininase family protein [Bacteroidetes bacterium]|nr:creatininase family protein [Bacteroidota bacterium]
MQPYVLTETNWKSVSETDFGTAVLPWGAIEAHNTHLPYGTDNIQLDRIAADACAVAWELGARVIALPTIPYGVNTGQSDITLDMNMMPSTQQALLGDIARVLEGQNILKLVVLNGHGGNNFRQMIREVGSHYPRLFICEVNWFKVLDVKLYFKDPGDHAGELETSLMLEIAPELVLPLDQAGSGAARPWTITGLNEGWAWAERRWSEVTEDTGVGDPRAASKAKGKLFLDSVTQKIGVFLTELDSTHITELYERR